VAFDPRRARGPSPTNGRESAARDAGHGSCKTLVSPDQLVLHPVARKWLRALTVGIVIAYVLFFALFWRQVGPDDSDQFLVFHTLQYWNSELFGLAKQWTPILCSGLSMAGEPQIPFMSLGMALSYVAGPLAGVKLELALYLLLGWVGAFLYAGLWLRLRPQRTLAAALFIGNGFFFCRLGLGHFDFAPFLILPLMLWTLHQIVLWSSEPPSLPRQVRFLLAALLMGAAIALAIDGSPVTLIHLMLWVGIYAVALSVSTRNPAPVALLACALIMAALLDAGYLWPMLEAQASYPRKTEDSFTSVLSLLWFALLPMRGKVLPANGNGHELSVFVGPLVAWCLWRHRRWIGSSLPATMRTPLIVVSLVSIVLGMGSLKGLHVPPWLSLFDSVRPLPGFRSINVTGRYWGFLALPLSLWGAAALWKTAAETGAGWRLHLLLGLVFVLQLGFQSETLGEHWIKSATYREVSSHDYFESGPEVIDYVAIAGTRLQGGVVSPARGVCDCYDMDDFVRAETGPGSDLIMGVMRDGTSASRPPALRAVFSSWSQIELHADCESYGASSCDFAPATRLQIILKQAYHANWQADGCLTQVSPRGNLTLDCPAARLLTSPIELVFRDATSDWAARISLLMWKTWMCLASAVLLVPGFALVRGRLVAAA
jgi:hypothetical protein